MALVSNDCPHDPPCPNRRGCRKYERMADREIAHLLMAADQALADLRHLQHAGRILAACPLDRLTPVDRHEYDAARGEFLATTRKTMLALREEFELVKEQTDPAALRKKWVH